MKLNIPYQKQEHKLDCGPTALNMILKYFNIFKTNEELRKLIMVEKSGATSTLGIAKASGELKLKTEFYTKIAQTNPENYKLEFYQEYADSLEDNLKKDLIMKKSCEENEVKIYEKTLTIKEIENKLKNNQIPIILLDWNIITNNKLGKMNGHFVPIVGFDDKNIYVHQQSGNNAKPYFEIEKKLFEKARTAPGTDEDIIFISKN